MNTWVYLRAPQSDECANMHTYLYRAGVESPQDKIKKIPLFLFRDIFP